MKKTLYTVIASLGFLGASVVGADAVTMLLSGNAGAGLLPGNENHVVTNGGSGGAVFLDYNPASNLLVLNLQWGSGNGFTDLSGTVSAGHIHGPTTSAAPASFGENAGVPTGFNLLTAGTVTVDTSASSGSAIGSITFLESQEADLLAGRFYFNFHTAQNGGGEIRGQIVQIPEPSQALLGLIGFVLIAFRRRR